MNNDVSAGETIAKAIRTAPLVRNGGTPET